jgi:anti-sigma B factor antagonist
MGFHVTPDDMPAPPIKISMTAGSAPHVVRISVAGEMDAATSPEVQAAIADALRRHRPRRIDLDLTGVTFLDSTGIRALVLGRADAEQVDCQLGLVGVARPVYQVLEIVGLLEVFGVTLAPEASRPVSTTRASGRRWKPPANVLTSNDATPP